MRLTWVPGHPRGFRLVLAGANVSSVSHTLHPSSFPDCLPCRLGNQTAVSRRRVPPRLKISVITGVPTPAASSSGAESEAESSLLFSSSGSGGSCFTSGRPGSNALLGQPGSNTGEVRMAVPGVHSSWASTFSCFTWGKATTQLRPGHCASCNRASVEAGAGPGTCTGLLAPSRKNTRSVPGGGNTKPPPASCFIGVWTCSGGAVDTANGGFRVWPRRGRRVEPGLFRRG